MTAHPAPQRLRRFLAGSLPFLYMALLAWLLLGPLWREAGLPNTADGILHLHRSAAMARSWASGLPWPRWFPAVYQGLGAPTFHYYSPLFYQVMAPLQLAGLPLDLATKLVISLFFLAAGLATWGWLRRLLGPAAGLAGATLYLAQPLFFREYYFQGDYPQLVALLWLPVVLWAFTRLYLDDRWFDRLAAPFSLALLIVAHNITALMGAGALALYSLALLAWKRDARGWLRLAVSAGLGLGLSAFFWLPALADADLVRVHNLQKGFFHFGQYFLSWADLLAPPPLLDSRAANPPFPHMLGWPAWLALAAGVVALIASFVRRSGWTASRFWIVAGIAFVAFCLWLTRPQSTLLWEQVPLLALIEFPSRWLAPAALGVALVGGAAITAWGERPSWWLLLALVLVVALSSAVFLFPHQPFRPFDVFTARNTQTYERHSQAWGLTSGNEFLPRWADPPRAQAARLAEQKHLPEGAEWRWETPHRAHLKPAPGTALPAGTLILPVHYFPAWAGMTGAETLPTTPSREGLVSLSLTQAANEVTLRWQGTFWQRVGQWLSLAALLAWAVWIGWRPWRGGREKQAPAPLPSWSATLGPLALLLFLILGREAVRALDLGWFQCASGPGEVRSVENPLHVELGGGEQPRVMLLGWDLLSGPHRPGSQLRLRLYWQGQERIEEPMHSFAFLYTPARQQSWAGVQNYNPGNIPTNRWNPLLYYVDDLTLPLPLDLPPTGYTLAVGMVDSHDERLTVPGSPDDLVFLDEVTVEPLRAGGLGAPRPQEATPASFGPNLNLWGYDLLPEPGGPVLRLYWNVRQTPLADLVTFVHLVDEEGQIVTQFDGPPLEGLLPTSQWPAGALLIDRRKISLPDDLASGSYRLLVGLYEPLSGQRLPVQPEAGASDHFAADALVIPLDVPEPSDLGTK